MPIQVSRLCRYKDIYLAVNRTSGKGVLLFREYRLMNKPRYIPETFKTDFEFRIKVLSLRHKFFNNCLSFKLKQNASKNQIATTWS